MTRRRVRRLSPHIRVPRFYRRRPIVCFIVGLLALLALVGRQGRHVDDLTTPEGDFAKYHNKTFRVVRVVDGDTMDLDVPDGHFPRTRVRLWGVDTPEVAGSPRGGMYWGAEASSFAKQILENAEVRLELVEGKTRGKFKRLLTYVYVDSTGEMFNELLLRGGQAYADTRFAHPRMEPFIALESEARASGVGLWADVSVEDMPRWRRHHERN